MGLIECLHVELHIGYWNTNSCTEVDPGLVVHSHFVQNDVSKVFGKRFKVIKMIKCNDKFLNY